MFLVVIGALWLTALPANLNASNGITADGTPTGDAAYAAACFLLAVAMTISVSIRARTTAEPAEVSDGDSQNEQSEVTP